MNYILSLLHLNPQGRDEIDVLLFNIELHITIHSKTRPDILH